VKVLNLHKVRVSDFLSSNNNCSTSSPPPKRRGRHDLSTFFLVKAPGMVGEFVAIGG
jgi:hypothetical protein